MMNEQTSEVKEKWCWTGFWQRLKTRRLTWDDGDALTFRVLIPFLSPTILMGLLLNSEEAVGYWARDLAYIWIAPLLVVLFCLLSYCTTPESKSIYRKIWGVVAPIGAGLLFTYGTIGYFVFANALTGSKELVAVHGPVVRKGHATSRITGFNAYLTFIYEGREVKLLVTTKDYDSHEIGDDYGQMMYRGGFGYFYRWEKFALWK